jgi:hypothetical protein
MTPHNEPSLPLHFRRIAYYRSGRSLRSAIAVSSRPGEITRKPLHADPARQLPLAWIIEPVSKLDSLRVLEEAGISRRTGPCCDACRPSRRIPGASRSLRCARRACGAGPGHPARPLRNLPVAARAPGQDIPDRHVFTQPWPTHSPTTCAKPSAAATSAQLRTNVSQVGQRHGPARTAVGWLRVSRRRGSVRPPRSSGRRGSCRPTAGSAAASPDPGRPAPHPPRCAATPLAGGTRTGVSPSGQRSHR